MVTDLPTKHDIYPKYKHHSLYLLIFDKPPTL